MGSSLDRSLKGAICLLELQSRSRQMDLNHRQAAATVLMLLARRVRRRMKPIRTCRRASPSSRRRKNEGCRQRRKPSGRPSWPKLASRSRHRTHRAKKSQNRKDQSPMELTLQGCGWQAATGNRMYLSVPIRSHSRLSSFAGFETPLDSCWVHWKEVI